MYLLTQLPYIGGVLALGIGHISLGALIFRDDSRLRPDFLKMLPSMHCSETESGPEAFGSCQDSLPTNEGLQRPKYS
jgi:hypothetical protein